MLHAMCRVGRGRPCQHCLSLSGCVWGGRPGRPSAALAVWQRQSSEHRLGASTAALSSPAPLSAAPPRPMRGARSPSRVWLCPSGTGCVRTTASGLSGAFPSMTCPGRSIKTKTHHRTEMLTAHVLHKSHETKQLI